MIRYGHSIAKIRVFIMKIASYPADHAYSDQLYELLDVFSAEQGYNTRKFKSEPYLFVITDEVGEFLGGIQGAICQGWLDIYSLYSTRTVKGVGAALMDHVESYAREKNCKGIKLPTYEFQAPEFYKKRGYEIYAQVPDLINGYDTIYMKKDLL